MSFTRPPKAHLMTYRIARGEQGVLTYEPYKSHLLPHWRFRTVPIAQESSRALWDKFLHFYDEGDFVGMDMSRKFIQMGMTRAKRYANHKGGRKYDGDGRELEKSAGHEGMEEKEEASRVFREVWERCRGHEGYGVLKRRFLEEQREWDRLEKKREVKEERVKIEENEGEEANGIKSKEESGKRKAADEPVRRNLRKRIKTETQD